jgi:hypothetical protein
MNNYIFDLILRLSESSGDPMDLSGLYDGLQSVMTAVALVGFLAAIIQCLFGFKLMKFWIAVQGLFIGGFVGAVISMLIGPSGPILLLFALIGAVIGAFVAFKLYKVGVFINCFGLGFFIVAGLVLAFINPSIAIPFGIIGGIAAGVIAVILIQPVFIISTSISGGMMAGSFMSTILQMGSAAGILFGFLFSGLGIFVQIKMNGGLFENKKQKPAYQNPYNNANQVNMNPNYSPNINSNLNPNYDQFSNQGFHQNNNPGFNPYHNNYNPNSNQNYAQGYNQNYYQNQNQSAGQNYSNPQGNSPAFAKPAEIPKQAPDTAYQSIDETAATNSTLAAAPTPPESRKAALYCPNCGNLCDAGTKFCTKCGQEVK